MVRLMTRALRGGARSRRSASQSGATVATRGSLTLGCSEKSPVKRASMISRSPAKLGTSRLSGPTFTPVRAMSRPRTRARRSGIEATRKRSASSRTSKRSSTRPRKVRVPSPCSVPRAPSRARTSRNARTSPSQTPSQETSE